MRMPDKLPAEANFPSIQNVIAYNVQFIVGAKGDGLISILWMIDFPEIGMDTPVEP